MKITEVLTLARNLMTQHGVGHLDLELSGTKRALGQCAYRRVGRDTTPTKIRLSKHWMGHLPESQVRDTILHEIAHAIAGFDAGHGPAWKSVCRRIGANPNRTADLPQDVVMTLQQNIANYKAVCTKCDNTHMFYRLTAKWKAGAYVCGKCKSPFKVYSL